MRLQRFAAIAVVFLATLSEAQGPANEAARHSRHRPQVWLAGIDPVVAAMSHNPGEADWMDLFAPNSPWPVAGRRVDVFFAGTQFFDHATDEQLTTVIQGLRARHIALGMAALMLVPTQRCGIGMGGYGRAGVMDHIAQRVTAMGGRLEYVRFDTPVWFGHHVSGGKSCHDSLPALAQQMIEPARALKTAFPNLSFVDAEPLNNHTDEGFLGEVLQFAVEFHKATGYKVDAIHADPIWRDDWQGQFRMWQARTRARGMRFGVICRGAAPDKTDKEWTAEAVKVIGQAMHAGNGPPDDIVVQTYNPLPAHMLPENDPASMTWIVKQALTK